MFLAPELTSIKEGWIEANLKERSRIQLDLFEARLMVSSKSVGIGAVHKESRERLWGRV